MASLYPEDPGFTYEGHSEVKGVKTGSSAIVSGHRDNDLFLKILIPSPPLPTHTS